MTVVSSSSDVSVSTAVGLPPWEVVPYPSFWDSFRPKRYKSLVAAWEVNEKARFDASMLRMRLREAQRQVRELEELLSPARRARLERALVEARSNLREFERPDGLHVGRTPGRGAL